MKTLLLHVCCAPCLAGVIEKLKKVYRISICFYNPNIQPKEEYQLRRQELDKLFTRHEALKEVSLISSDYELQKWERATLGYESEKEGGPRCIRCFQMRLEKIAYLAFEYEFDLFTTTLTISPLKNAQTINEIGQALAAKYKVGYLAADFKKHDGFKLSCEKSKIYNLYRQDFCGCLYSRRPAKAN